LAGEETVHEIKEENNEDDELSAPEIKKEAKEEKNDYTSEAGVNGTDINVN
jgi:hypothetical protein